MAVTLAELKNVLGISQGDASRDSEIQRALDAAILLAESETGHYFGDVALTTEIIKGQDSATLWLKQIPTSPILSVNWYTGPGADAVVINAADSNGYLERGKQLVRKLGSVWAYGHEYEVTYERGYAGGAMPADAEMWIIAMVSAMWSTIHAGGKTSETFGTYSYSLDPSKARGLPGGAETLARFKRFRV
jgi:hypothetical protein